jgi:hypothetical protein
MHRPSYESIVDQMVSALGERRRSRIERQAAYVALARAIVADEPTSFEFGEPSEMDGVVSVSSAAA